MNFPLASSAFVRMTVWLLCFSLVQGCAIYRPTNQPMTRIENDRGYRLVNAHLGKFGDHLVFLAFSGGGTRAAALSYGVLKELRDTQLDAAGQRVRLLDEVDSISAVSGGSFTAAYFGLFGEKTFTDYEKVFLRQSIQGSLILKLFSPSYWWNSVFSGFDRTEMAVDFYDKQIFEGKTFEDLQHANGPFIEINATDLGIGNRFSFIQGYFDLLCSDLGPFKVARAVTASSAVPVAFPTVVLKNYAGECDPSQSNLITYFNRLNESNPRAMDIRKRIKSYLDRDAHAYVHLVDGGITDNLGLRALTDRIETMGSGDFIRSLAHKPKDVLIISVNAQVKPERGIDLSPDKPSIPETVDAFSDAQMALYNNETKFLLEKKVRELEARLKEHGVQTRIYTAEVSFESVQAKTMKSYLNSLPTSLELSNQDVDMLIEAAATILRRDPGYRAFLENNAGRYQFPVSSTKPKS